MKINIEIECTPAEARAFMGLPDFEPMQQRALAEMERRMMESLDTFSPDSLLKLWMQPVALNADWLQDLMRRATK
ncbi:hypothetical protein GJ654_18080 [Rhodoblastus acidophilus]|uniref:Ribosomal protein S1 n=1 Tax=Rhodoblastus acidophilus TaxID=1074 RepID=A0A6N8DQK8_RHOAC|nr:DUF6489 family protein [Rhodoblastus acidophilus]MCW2276229.1 hypothetical protein [Rhodoblastus acidophilus]MTV32892.1 hypothetical protein [Rhodoblastus acidophilus]